MKRPPASRAAKPVDASADEQALSTTRPTARRWLHTIEIPISGPKDITALRWEEPDSYCRGADSRLARRFRAAVENLPSDCQPVLTGPVTIHFVDRDGGPWGGGPADDDPTLTVEAAAIFTDKLYTIVQRAVELRQQSARRRGCDLRDEDLTRVEISFLVQAR